MAPCLPEGPGPALLVCMSGLAMRSPTWLKPVDTRCSLGACPGTSRPSLLFSWAGVLWGRKDGEEPQGPPWGVHPPEGRLRAGAQLGPAPHPEGRPGHQAWA